MRIPSTWRSHPSPPMMQPTERRDILERLARKEIDADEAAAALRALAG